MNIHMEYEANVDLDFDYNKLINDVIIECIRYEGCPYEPEISVLLTNDKEIQEINKEFRGIDKATDVLSFPMIDYDKPGDFSDLKEEARQYFNPDTGHLLLGDIVISVERAIKQAEEYGHSITREIGFLTAHSMFHLMGYDHISDEERLIMEDKQDDVLSQLNILK